MGQRKKETQKGRRKKGKGGKRNRNRNKNMIEEQGWKIQSITKWRLRIKLIEIKKENIKAGREREKSVLLWDSRKG